MRENESERMAQFAYYGLSSGDDKLEAELLEIETQLKLRIKNVGFVPWGRKQSNDWDRLTNFIYKIQSWEICENKIRGLKNSSLENYAINRWFNFWSAYGIEKIFCSLPGVQAHKNRFDKLIDFNIQGINFDHKSTVFPKGYKGELYQAKCDPKSLVLWLYNSQSRQGRYHFGNRLFIVFFDHIEGDHWKSKAELFDLRSSIKSYVKNFNQDNLIRFQKQGKEILSDIIWAEIGNL